MTRDDIELELKRLGLGHLISDAMISELQVWSAESD
jgi:hypothetical protein